MKTSNDTLTNIVVLQLISPERRSTRQDFRVMFGLFIKIHVDKRPF